MEIDRASLRKLVDHRGDEHARFLVAVNAFLNKAVSVDHGRMVTPAEVLPDDGEAMRSQPSREIHGRVTSADYFDLSAAALQGANTDMLALGNGALN